MTGSDRCGPETDAPSYALDIETTGLTWPESRVTTVAVYSPEVSFVSEDTDERRLIIGLLGHLGDLPAGEIVTWNGACFDWPFVAGRARHLGVEWPEMIADASIRPKYDPQPGFEPVGYSPAVVGSGGVAHRHRDVAYLWRDWAETHQVRWSLKPITKAWGISVIEVDRERMDALSVAERMAYNLSDVVATWQLGRLSPAG